MPQHYSLVSDVSDVVSVDLSQSADESVSGLGTVQNQWVPDWSKHCDNQLVLKEDLELRDVVAKTMVSLHAELKDRIPAMLDVYSQQVDQMHAAVGGHFHELLTAGALDLATTSRIIDLISGQLFSEQSPLQQIRSNLRTLQRDFNNETQGPNGLRTNLRRKRDSLQGALTWYGVATGQCLCLPCVADGCSTAGEAAHKVYANSLRPRLEEVFTTRWVDTAAKGASATTVGGVCYAVFGVFGGLLGCAAVAMTFVTISRSEQAATNREAHRFKHLSTQLCEVDQIENVCRQVEFILERADRQIEKVTLYQRQFENLKGQVDVLLKNPLDVKRWSAARMSEYLKSQDLQVCAKIFEERRVSGKAFINDVSKQELGKMGIADDLSLQRLLTIQKELQSGPYTEPSRRVHDLAESVNKLFVDVKTTVAKVKDFLQRF